MQKTSTSNDSKMGVCAVYAFAFGMAYYKRVSHAARKKRTTWAKTKQRCLAKYKSRRCIWIFVLWLKFHTAIAISKIMHGNYVQCLYGDTNKHKHTHAHRERKREIRAFKTGMQLFKSMCVYLCTMLYKSTCKYSYRMHIEMTQRSYGLM